MKKKYFLIAGIASWLFFFWLWSYRLSVRLGQKEIERAESFAETLAARNVYYLQNGLESLISLQPAMTYPGVVEVLLADAQGEIITRQGNREKQKALRLERAVLGLNQESLGKVILFYRQNPNRFFIFWILIFLPVPAVVYFYFFEGKKKAALVKRDEAYPWLPAAENFLAKKLCVFDSSGNILAPNGPGCPKHLLDLFADPKEAQVILKKMETLENPFWRNSDDEIRFLLAYP